MDKQDKNQPSIVDSFKRIWTFLKKDQKRMKVLVGITLICQVFSAMQPFFLKYLVAGVAERQSLALLLPILLGLCIFYGIQYLIQYLLDCKKFDFEQFSVNNDMVISVLQKTLHFSIGQHLNESSGVKHSIIRRGQNALEDIVCQLIYTVIPCITMLVVILCILASINPSQCIFLLVLVGILLWTTTRYNTAYMRIPHMEVEKLERSLWRHIDEINREVETVKQFGKEDREIAGLTAQMEHLHSKLSLIYKPYFWFIFKRELFTKAAYICMLGYSIHQIASGTYAPEALFMLILWSGQALDSVRHLDQFERRLGRNLASINQMFAMLDIIPDVQEDPKTVTPIVFSGAIEFRNVSFGYDQETSCLSKGHTCETNTVTKKKSVLKNFNIIFEAGKTTAIVGHTGSGKSTIVRLIQRQTDVHEGSILMDGVPLQKLPFDFLRKNMGIVSQDVRLFDSTIKENILYGIHEKDSITDEYLEELSDTACLHVFRERLSDGLDTYIGEHGIRLSGGQQQLTSIARALANDPKILIFDEATSALDVHTEAQIKEAMKNASKGRTTIIIAHRLSTIRHADKIIMLHEGAVVGEGTHEELFQNCRAYHDLVSTQLSEVKHAFEEETGMNVVNEKNVVHY